MTDREQAYFMYGYVYCQAEELRKKLDCYKDWTIKEIIKELLEGAK